MAFNLNLRKKVHRKLWEPLFTPLPIATNTGGFFAKDRLNLGDGNQCYYLTSATVHYAFSAGEEGFGQLPSSASVGTFGSGAAGVVHPTASAGTASAGTTTSFTTTLTIVRDLRGYRCRITAGTNAGQERIIASNTIGANAVITVQDAYGAACDATSVFVLFTNRLWFYVPGATAGFNVYDWALNTWTSKTVVSGPATTAGNDGVIVATASQEFVADYSTALGSQTTTTLQDTSRAWLVNKWAFTLVKIISGTGVGQQRFVTSNTANTLTVNAVWTITPDATSVYEVGSFAAGIASAGAATTLTVTTGGPAYATNGWANYQIRIVGGTGVGQVRLIASNTSGATSVITISVAWTTNPDATSMFVIEGNDDILYYMGNNTSTLFKFVPSASAGAGAWSTITPGSARGATPNNGISANYIATCDDPSWMAQTGPANATTYRQNGRYMFSFRGNATGALDLYDIVANIWITGILFGGATNETFTTGTTWADLDGYIYAQKDATGRFFRFDCAKNELLSINTNTIAQGTAIQGLKIFIDKYLDKTNGKFVRIIYWAVNTSTSFWRMLEI